jgi:alkyl sulfatase BDS1-like metallo-beta-lactamase superfamily hydrolase
MDWLCTFRAISRAFSAILIAAAAPVSAQQTVAETELATGKRLLAQEHPDVLRVMARNDGFGGPRSSLIANRMQDRAPELVEEARSKMTVEPQGEGLWLIRFPYVNVVLVETRDSLVVLDTGYAAIGPVLRDLIPTLSAKPLKTIVMTHTHVDHAYGAFALLKDKPQIIASELFPRMADTDIRLRGSIAKYNNQPLANQPTSRADFVMPTLMFRDRMERTIGGEKFVFIHAKGETEEQIYIWMPRRKALITADYYQGFLPNAGNGKRIQRHVEEWTAALRHMISLKPALLLPMHGKAIVGEAPVAEALGTTADAMEHITKQVVDRLNTGDRKDVILSSLDWPERFAKSPLLTTSYVRPEDIGKMVAHRWTGWWDDIPSHYNALNFEEEAREAVALAGGVVAIDKRARALLENNPRLATRLADWAFFGAPDDPIAMQLAVYVYMARIAAPDTPIQEATIYLDIAARARARLDESKKSAH